jgi:hypothetical protein
MDFMSSFRGDHPRTQAGQGTNHGDTCHNEFRYLFVSLFVCLSVLHRRYRPRSVVVVVVVVVVGGGGLFNIMKPERRAWRLIATALLVCTCTTSTILPREAPTPWFK